MGLGGMFRRETFSQRAVLGWVITNATSSVYDFYEDMDIFIN
jgi:hypothetical protein